MKRAIIVLAFCVVLAPFLFDIIGWWPLSHYTVRLIKIISPLCATVLALISIAINKAETRLSYVILIFSLALLAVSRFPLMDCSVDTLSISQSIDGLADALRR